MDWPSVKTTKSLSSALHVTIDAKVLEEMLPKVGVRFVSQEKSFDIQVIFSLKCFPLLQIGFINIEIQILPHLHNLIHMDV